MENIDISKLDKFLCEIEYSERIALVTSGSVSSKINKYLNIQMDKSTTDRKGVEYAEELLKKGYHVIFLYRENSNTPFIHHTTMPEHSLIQNGELIFLDNFKHNLILYKSLSEKYSKNLFLIPFTEIEEYKILLEYINLLTIFKFITLRFLVNKISPFQERSIIILGANINKYDVEKEDKMKVIINERDPLSLTLIPNVLDMYLIYLNIFRNYIKKKAVPKAILFDLIIEPNESSLFSISQEYMENFQIDYIIANTQENRYDKVYLVSPNEKFEVFRDESSTLDEKLINMIVSLHNLHVQKCNYD